MLHGARRDHHPCGSSRRKIFVCDPDSYHRRDFRFVPGGYLQKHKRRGANANCLPCGRAENGDDRGSLRRTAASDCRCRADYAERRHRGWRRRIRIRRAHRPADVLRHQRALEFRGRSGAYARIQSLRALGGFSDCRGACSPSEAAGATSGGGRKGMRYGYWLPVFGGWLRNVADENMQATWAYVKRLAQRSEQIGFDITLIAELNLNDIKGVEAPSLDAWSTAAALAAVTERIELMVAVRPTFHLPALLAKQAANIDRISNGRLTLNVVSSWWADEARKYGVSFEQHDDRYARTSEWLDVLDGVWSRDHFSYAGKYCRVEHNVLEPKPVVKPRPCLYAGGESAGAKELIAEKCDAYLMHGDPPERVREKIADLRERRAKRKLPALKFGVAGYACVRETEREAQDELRRIMDVQQSAAGYANYQQWLAGTQLEQRVSLEDYSVSNRGLRSGLIGTPEQVAERVAQFEAAGVDLVLLQFSPQHEEMDRFANTVIRRRWAASALAQ